MKCMSFLKNCLTCITILLFVCFVLSFFSSAQAKSNTDKVYKLTLAHFQPSTHPVETVLIQTWIDKIEEATDGQVKITSHPGGTLLNGPQIYEGVIRGSADIGHSCYAYTRGRFPVIEALMVPGLVYKSAKSSDWVATKAIKQLDTPGLDSVKHLFTFTTGKGDLMTTKPVKNLQNLGSLTIGVTSGERADAMDFLGSTGVVKPMPAHFEMISKGVTDGVVAPMETLKSFGLAEVVNYVTETPFLYNQLLFMVMNKDTWNSLPNHIQKSIEKVNKSYYKSTVAGFYDKLNKDGKKYAKDEENIKFYNLTDQQKQNWKEKLDPLIENRINKLNKRGLPGEKILDTILELAEKYNQKYGN